MIPKNYIKTLFISLNISNYYLLTHADNTICPLPDTIHNWSYFSNTYDNGQQYAVYYTVPDQKADAYSFAEYCGSLTDDSNMARIFNQQENDFLTENLLIGVKQAWIGGYYLPVFTKNETFQGWMWLDQKVLSASHSVIKGPINETFSNGIFSQNIWLMDIRICYKIHNFLFINEFKSQLPRTFRYLAAYQKKRPYFVRLKTCHL